MAYQLTVKPTGGRDDVDNHGLWCFFVSKTLRIQMQESYEKKWKSWKNISNLVSGSEKCVFV